MLDKGGLKDDIQGALEDVLPTALAQCIQGLFTLKTDTGDQMAENFGKNLTEMIAEPLATRISDGIDAYVKCMSIQGTLITIGSPFTQTAQVMSLPMPALNGKVPMTLGVS